jgi:hypothetical protein
VKTFPVLALILNDLQLTYPANPRRRVSCQRSVKTNQE